jgi:very-short-patch-repair endonuclease
VPKLAQSAHRSALIQARAHAFRVSPTLSERKLWLELSAAKLGVAFRRQVPLAGRWIADFFAPSLRLVVEVDGSVHERTRCGDARRAQKLNRLGYHVLRLDAELIIRDLPAAVLRVRVVIEALRR